MVVYVLDREGKPLMPTERFGWVAYALKHGEARVVRREPFTIQLLRDSTTYLQVVTLGVDVGSKHVGLSASTKRKELYSSQFELRDDVTKLLTARREFRRGRRGRKHNWYRPARWENRANQRNKDLPPSIRHKADSHVRLIEAVRKVLPICQINLEVGKFDSQKIANPEIHNEQYQQGALADWENLKAYAKWRDGYKCRACGATPRNDPKVRLEVHHIIRRADGGTDVPENVVTLCHDCHEGHHQGKKKLKFKKPPPHKGEAHMNAMKDYLVSEVRKMPCAVHVTFGYKTAMARREHGIEKSHANDAFCIAGNFGAERNGCNVYVHKFVRRHRRDTHAATIKSPYKVSREVQVRMTEKERRNGYRRPCRMLKSVKGFSQYDTVSWKGKRWTIGGLRSTGSFYLVRHGDGVVKDGVNYRKIRRLYASRGCVVERRSRNSSQR